MTQAKVVEWIAANNFLELEKAVGPKQSWVTDTTYKVSPALLTKSHVLLRKRKIIAEDGLSLLHVAAIYDSFECFLVLSQYLAVDIVSAGELYPLHYACAAGSVEIASYILSTDKGKLQAGDRVGRMSSMFLLYLAIASGSAKIVELLLNCGAWNPRSAREFDSQMLDMVLLVVHKKNLEVLSLLADHLRPLRDRDGRDALLACIKYNKWMDGARLLLERGYDPGFKRGRDGKVIGTTCSLWAACERGRDWIDIIKIMASRVEKRNADLNVNEATSSRGQNPGLLNYACRSASCKVVREIQRFLDKRSFTNRSVVQKAIENVFTVPGDVEDLELKGICEILQELEGQEAVKGMAHEVLLCAYKYRDKTGFLSQSIKWALEHGGEDGFGNLSSWELEDPRIRRIRNEMGIH